MNRYRYTSDSIFWFNIEPDVDERSIHTGSIFGKLFPVVVRGFLSSHGPLPLIEKEIISRQKSAYTSHRDSCIERIWFFKSIFLMNAINPRPPKRGIVRSCRRPMIQKKLLFATSVIPVVSPFEFVVVQINLFGPYSE